MSAVLGSMWIIVVRNDGDEAVVVRWDDAFLGSGTRDPTGKPGSRYAVMFPRAQITFARALSKLQQIHR